MAKPSTRQLVEAVGISRSYAHELLNTSRTPSPTLAAKIYNETGLKLGLFETLSDADAQVAARIHGEQ